MGNGSTFSDWESLAGLKVLKINAISQKAINLLTGLESLSILRDAGQHLDFSANTNLTSLSVVMKHHPGRIVYPPCLKKLTMSTSFEMRQIDMGAAKIATLEEIELDDVLVTNLPSNLRAVRIFRGLKSDCIPSGVTFLSFFDVNFPELVIDLRFCRHLKVLEMEENCCDQGVANIRVLAPPLERLALTDTFYGELPRVESLSLDRMKDCRVAYSIQASGCKNLKVVKSWDFSMDMSEKWGVEKMMIKRSGVSPALPLGVRYLRADAIPRNLGEMVVHGLQRVTLLPCEDHRPTKIRAVKDCPKCPHLPEGFADLQW
jgi:hypothetical protein